MSTLLSLDFALKRKGSRKLDVIKVLLTTARIIFSPKTEPVLNIKRRARTLFII